MTERPAVSKELQRIMAAAKPRAAAKATNHMRERIAVAIRASRPNCFGWSPQESYAIYLREPQNMREMYERWADELLRHLDVYNLEVIDVAADGEEPKR